MKRYLVTGATSGLGASVAMSLLDDQRNIVDVVGRDKDKILSIFNGCVNARMRQCDFAVTEPQLITEMVRQWTTEHDGHAYDGIFHAAGSELVSLLRTTTDEAYALCMMAANSAFAILRACSLKSVTKEGCSVVLMSSVASHRGTPGMVAYSASKGAIEGMVRSAAIELSHRHLRVNAIAAGAFRSPMHDRITRKMLPASQDAYGASHPLGIGSIEAVSDVVVHLLSPASRWVTGTVQIVDGGYLAK